MDSDPGMASSLSTKVDLGQHQNESKEQLQMCSHDLNRLSVQDIQYLYELLDRHGNANYQKFTNPYPIAMFAFGMSVVLIGQTGIRDLPIDAISLVQGTFYAGVGQSICGFMSFFYGSILGTFLGFMFGSWWYCNFFNSVGMNLGPTGWADPDSNLGAFLPLIPWIIYFTGSAICLASNMKKDSINFITMTSIIFCNVFFAIVIMHSNQSWANFLANLCIIIAGVLAMYIAASVFLFEIHGREVLPLGYGFLISDNNNNHDAKNDGKYRESVS